MDELAAELGLRTPPIAWHVGRDGLAEVAGFLGLLTGSLGKIATDVALLMQAEIGEVAEPYQEGRGGSSTMPQKRNPIACEFILACAKNVRQLVPVMLDAMVQDHERATGPWHAEWIALPEAFALSAGALHHARALLEGLVVDPARMRRNLDITQGMISAEAVMMALAPHVGREQAHHMVAAACDRALAHGRHLRDELAGGSGHHGAPAAAAPGRAARSAQLYRACRRIRRSRPRARQPPVRLKGGVHAQDPGERHPALLRARGAGGCAGRDAEQLARHAARDVGPAGARAGRALPRAALRQPRPRPLATLRTARTRSTCWPTTRSVCSTRSVSSARISAGCPRAAWSVRCWAPDTASG